jgi:hypothetical protein
MLPFIGGMRPIVGGRNAALPSQVAILNTKPSDRVAKGSGSGRVQRLTAPNSTNKGHRDKLALYRVGDHSAGQVDATTLNPYFSRMGRLVGKASTRK